MKKDEGRAVPRLSNHPACEQFCEASHNDILPQVVSRAQRALPVHRLRAAASHPSCGRVGVHRGPHGGFRLRRPAREAYRAPVPVPGAPRPPLVWCRATAERARLLSVWQVYCYVTAFTLVFRTNTAFARYWEARNQCTLMSSKWGDFAAMLLTFDHRCGTVGSECIPFVHKA